jgi:pyruvate/2-oxoacid:ferredoxin oxidoreductase alpha subunit
VLADGYLGQMTGKVVLPRQIVRPGVPAWCTAGDAAHQRSIVTSIFLEESELEAVNHDILAAYGRMSEREQRSEQFACDDADVLIVACNTPARTAKGAVRTLRAAGIRAGLFRPITLWPFPIRALEPVLARVRHVVVVEASDRQLENELRLAMSYVNAGRVRISRVNRYGGVLPSHDEIVEQASRTPA